MATHFARGIISPKHLTSTRLSSECHAIARGLPEHLSARFIAARSLLAELLFMLYGIGRLPKIIESKSGRLCFADPMLADFSLSCAGNIVGVALTPDGRCGLDMAIQRPSTGTRTSREPLSPQQFTRNETIWIHNQKDPQEASLQLATLRRSVMKLTNQNNLHIDDIQLLPGAGRLRVADIPEVEALCDAEDVLVWALAGTPSVVPVTLWEFDNRQGWRKLPDIQTRCHSPDGRIMRFTSMPSEKALMI
ncbi:4'-phosphopantetheinyl transferase family protein [Entomohabitans teleogrylli]|uniref:4'-phosphopantetheinyl transferase family protein n=1 Tax=Entomohabitans teleogrylli TaxID=1384589 RepID=UPI00073D8A4A|nr:hypothetical protein [Entomohabitans teleogrylli]